MKITKHCVLTSGGVENNGAHSNNIVFTIKDFYCKIICPSLHFISKRKPKSIKTS